MKQRQCMHSKNYLVPLMTTSAALFTNKMLKPSVVASMLTSLILTPMSLERTALFAIGERQLHFLFDI